MTVRVDSRTTDHPVYGHGHGFVVYVRQEDDEGFGAGRVYGLYEKRGSAEVKAAQINARLGKAGAQNAAAYVVPLDWATTSAQRIAKRALS